LIPDRVVCVRVVRVLYTPGRTTSYVVMATNDKDVNQHPRQYCYFCGSEGPIETHHIVPRRHDGSDDDSNLVDVCPTCHQRLEHLYDEGFYRELECAKKVEPVVTYNLEEVKSEISDFGQNFMRKTLKQAISNARVVDNEQEHELVIKDLLNKGVIAKNGRTFTPLFELPFLTDEEKEKKKERKRIMNMKTTIKGVDKDPVPVEDVITAFCQTHGMNKETARNELKKLRTKGEVYEPKKNHLRAT